MKNVAVFPCSTENALEVHDALKYRRDLRIIGYSSNKNPALLASNQLALPPIEALKLTDQEEHAPLVYKDSFLLGSNIDLTLPMIRTVQSHKADKRFDEINTTPVDSIISTFHQHDIDIIIPTHDTIAYALARCLAGCQPRIKTGFKEFCFYEKFFDHYMQLATSPSATARVCRYKKLTMETFARYDFCPKFFDNPSEVKPKDFPVHVKPNAGESSRGTKVVYNRNTFDMQHCVAPEQWCFQEYLQGREYTVDCFTNSEGKLLWYGIRRRCRIRGGQSVRSETVDVFLGREAGRIAEQINTRLRFCGQWFFQLKDKVSEGKDGGNLKLTEISCRPSGGAGLWRQFGINLPLLTIYDALGEKVEILTNQNTSWSGPNRPSGGFDKAFITRFYSNLKYNRVFIDLDDTILDSDGYARPIVVAYLYHLMNKGIPIQILTRLENPQTRMIKANLPGWLFASNNTIVVHERSGKSDIIYKYLAMNPIFIDDSFTERKIVQDRLNIPVFDVDAIQCLFDWRDF